MLVALFPHPHKPESKHLALAIADYLTTRGIRVVSEATEAASLQVDSMDQIDLTAIDICLSMGGDGSILTLVHKYPQIDAPFLGINLGHLGFMADVPIGDIYVSLQDLVLKNYTVEERLILEAELPHKVTDFAINDVVIHRGRNPNLVEMVIHVDGTYVNTFLADGLIIATPNGSTAYSLAAGGPILTPKVEAIVVTPISPHTISNRPIVLSSDVEIDIQYTGNAMPLEISIDGMTHRHLGTAELLRIRASSKRFRLVHLKRHDYFFTLRTKLNWTGRLR